jgi:precorrin-6B methylase 2
MSLLSPIIKLAKSGLPDRDILLPVIAGPFRGARFFSNPQVAMRKVFGAYEHELTGWLERALPRIDVIVDVGANDGYFTFGCAKALQRSGKEIRVIAIEASESHVKRLEEARAQNGLTQEQIQIVHAFAGNADDATHRTLDSLTASLPPDQRVFVKVDVEGAEGEVLEGAQRLLRKSNLFLIEVHTPALFRDLPPVFAGRGLEVEYIHQKPHPILGRERRDESNWWLVNKL